MAAEKLTYCKAGGPPDDWRMWRVFDLDTGQEVREVDEVNTAEGWLIRCVVDERGRIKTTEKGEIWYVKHEGRFELRRVDDPSVGPRTVYAE